MNEFKVWVGLALVSAVTMVATLCCCVSKDVEIKNLNKTITSQNELIDFQKKTIAIKNEELLECNELISDKLSAIDDYISWKDRLKLSANDVPNVERLREELHEERFKVILCANMYADKETVD